MSAPRVDTTTQVCRPHGVQACLDCMSDDAQILAYAHLERRKARQQKLDESRVIIAGSRDLFVSTTLIGEELGKAGWALTEIVSGGAKGVDTCGEHYARHHGLRVKRFLADWEQHGKAAGPLRNKEMADYADAALVLCDEQPTPGSANMATWMLALGKPVRVVLVGARVAGGQETLLF